MHPPFTASMAHVWLYPATHLRYDAGQATCVGACRAAIALLACAVSYVENNVTSNVCKSCPWASRST